MERLDKFFNQGCFAKCCCHMKLERYKSEDRDSYISEMTATPNYLTNKHEGYQSIASTLAQLILHRQFAFLELIGDKLYISLACSVEQVVFLF